MPIPISILTLMSCSSRLPAAGAAPPSPAVVLGRDPTAHVLGAVDDLGTSHFSAREKPHRLTIDERDVLQVENDAIVRHGREQLLQTLRMLDVEHSAEDENTRAALCGLVDSISHLVRSARPARGSVLNR